MNNQNPGGFNTPGAYDQSGHGPGYPQAPQNPYPTQQHPYPTQPNTYPMSGVYGSQPQPPVQQGYSPYPDQQGNTAYGQAIITIPLYNLQPACNLKEYQYIKNEMSKCF